MSIRVACPHCNGVVTLAAVPPSGRAACPRCGELIPVKGAEPVPDDVPQPAALAPHPPGFPSRALLLSLGLAAVILVIGMSIFRPWEQTSPQPVADRPPGTTPPAALAGLGYLPPTANVVLAVQPAPLLAYAERTKADPKELLTRSGVPAPVTDALDRFGLPLDQIDSAVVGLSLTDQALPGVTGVLTLRRPVADEDEFLRRLRAEKKPVAGRPVYTVTAGFPLVMTKVDPTTYLFGLTDTDLKAADAPHPPGGGHLPVDLRESLTARLSPASFAWVATASEKWAEKPVLKLALKAPQLVPLTQIRAAAVGVSLEPDPVLKVALKPADADARGWVRAEIGGRVGELASINDAGDWVTVETPVDLRGGADVGRMLNR